MSMPSLVLSKHNPLQNLLRSKLVYSLHVPGLRVRNYLLLIHSDNARCVFVRAIIDDSEAAIAASLMGWSRQWQK